jgi:6-pyruvoyltetrahydropterin/6-carboxytetrahydropterin synthase
MRWQISKEFDFCYGHRVWSQELDKEFSINGCLACRHLHGHQGKVIIHLESDKLNKGMVTDFNHLNWFKQFLNDTVDHKFIIDSNDPLFDTMLSHYKGATNLIDMGNGYKIPDLNILKDEPSYIKEMYDGYIIVDFVPTSENISAWLMKIVQSKMDKFDVKVSHIEFYESPKSKSVVYST